MHLLASRHPKRRSSVGSRLLALLILAVCAGAQLLGCSAECDDSKETDPPAEIEDSPTGAPYLVSLRRLGAPDGGAWTAPTRGGRVLLWLSKTYLEDNDAYLAVLRTGERPVTFAIFELDVSSKGELSMGLAPVGRREDGSIEVLGVTPRIYILGAAKGDVIQVRDTVGDEEVLFRSGTEFQRCSKREQKEIRKTVHESIK